METVAAVPDMFLDWEDAFAAGVGTVGGKGWNLGRLARYGLPVPSGGVLTAQVYQGFLDHNRLRDQLEEVSALVTVGNIAEAGIQTRLEALRQSLLQGRWPESVRERLAQVVAGPDLKDKPLAVRSSASCEDSPAASFAGIHDSSLNVNGLDRVLQAIADCYASLWTPRAVAYRRKMEIRDSDMAVAVVITEMIPAEAAGVAFSCDPRTGRQELMLINANFGLGESVVAGSIDPDQYTLGTDPSRTVPAIVARQLGRKQGKTVARNVGGGGTEFVETAGQDAAQVLSDENIIRLGLLILRVLDALGEGTQHQDIEWVFAGGRFALVQARPVTALPGQVAPGLENFPEYWSNGNFRDAAPMVLSTVNRSITRDSISTIISAPYLAAGYPLPDGLQFSRFFQGRVYFNLSLAQWNSFDAFGIPPAETNANLGGHQPKIPVDAATPYRGVAGMKRIGRVIKLLRALDRCKRKAPESFARVRALCEILRQKDHSAVDGHELLSDLSRSVRAFLDFAPEFGLLICASGTLMPLIKELEKSFPGRGNALAAALMAGGAETTSAAQGYRLMEMAEEVSRDPDAGAFFAADPFDALSWEKLPEESPFKSSFRAFLAEFGHRAVYEVESMNPRWREEPGYLLQVIRSMIGRADLSALRTRQRELSDRAWREVRDKLPLPRRLLVRYLVKQSRTGAEIREMAKSICFMPTEPIRKMLLEAGARLRRGGILSEPEDIFHCAWSEFFSVLRGDWDGKGLDILVRERKARRAEMEALAAPDLFIGDAPQAPHVVCDLPGEALSGLGVAAGRGEGAARIVLHPQEGGRLGHGEVLVAPSTDPAWTPLFLRASAIVMETGGHLSHGAIVAREYGIPAVVNVPGVLRRLRDGELIVVDGDAGKVFKKN